MRPVMHFHPPSAESNLQHFSIVRFSSLQSCGRQAVMASCFLQLLRSTRFTSSTFQAHCQRLHQQQPTAGISTKNTVQVQPKWYPFSFSPGQVDEPRGPTQRDTRRRQNTSSLNTTTTSTGPSITSAATNNVQTPSRTRSSTTVGNAPRPAEAELRQPRTVAPVGQPST